MFQSHFGEFAALMTAVFWTITALAFEGATKRVGPFAVNLIRLLFAIVLLSIMSYFSRGIAFPVDATTYMWFWLGLSGVVGFIIGDYFLFASYPQIGSRMAMLMMTLAPPMAAFFGWMVLGETMNLKGLAGMLLVLSGIGIAIWSKPSGEKKAKLKFPIKGLLFAFIGALGQGGGIVLSKYGMGEYNAFAATQIRVIVGIIGFTIIITFLRRWRNVTATFKNKLALRGIVVGSIFGPFLGVSFSLLAVQNTNTGIASTIMAIVPVLIILPAVVLYKQKVSWAEVAGAFLSVLGVAMFFI
ncbi:DMT family transporter [Lentimicrobium sp. S6]|uniref:DMT family transporter n=1 Tax=Lentimicrobium sp. S6 TaxID=2735872 RepID=UPI001551912A|nr:DMT family transporter [Lentimicrobium sp. S6]NPD43988.1 DMT family transporter [Lentimicrobium sp. S6]